MNLSTHTVYPDTSICGDTFKWVARLLERDGTIVKSFTGEAASYDDARGEAHAAVTAVESDYLIEDK